MHDEAVLQEEVEEVLVFSGLGEAALASPYRLILVNTNKAEVVGIRGQGWNGRI